MEGFVKQLCERLQIFVATRLFFHAKLFYNHHQA